MNKDEILSGIEKTGIVAVLRLNNTQDFDCVIEALFNGGVNAIEITLTTPDALQLIQKFASKKYNNVYLGAGTVMNLQDARDVTPTEIYKAWKSGADVVKVFPATTLGPKFFKDVRGPMPFLKLTPTGGVSVENAADFIKAGALFLGAGTAMLNKKMIKERNWSGLSEFAAQFVNQVSKARKELN